MVSAAGQVLRLYSLKIKFSLRMEYIWPLTNYLVQLQHKVQSWLSQKHIFFVLSENTFHKIAPEYCWSLLGIFSKSAKYIWTGHCYVFFPNSFHNFSYCKYFRDVRKKTFYLSERATFTHNPVCTLWKNHLSVKILLPI